MLNYLKVSLFFACALLMACGESETPKEVSTPVMETAPAKVEAATEAMPEETEKAVSATEEVATQLPAEVESAVTAVEAVKEEAEAAVEAVAGDKPYQLVDGGISANAIEGWKTYNGGGCGGCHGQGGKGAIGPNLGESVTQKLSKEEFFDVVANGRSGTFMKPHKTNKRVMDNLENLYAYFMARGDGVLGPGNLIKLPLGK